MKERIVKQWANEILYNYGGARYDLLLLSGEHIGEEIFAASDEEAIEKAALVSRDAWNNKRAIVPGREVLRLLEEANKGDMLDKLNDDELHRLHGLLFTWSDIAKMEIEQRRSA